MATNRSTVLGLCSYTHDSAAALLVDGQLVGFVEEERLSAIKHDKSYPAKAVDWLLDEAGLTRADIGTVAYNFTPQHYLRALPAALAHAARPATAARALPRARSFAEVAGNTRRRLARLADAFPNAAVQPVLHHRAHGLYAFAASGYDEAAVLVVDSLGETQATTIGHARQPSGGCSYRIVHALDDPASLGYVYGAVTEHLGWRRGDEEGTVMALAALGDPKRFRSLFAKAVRLTTNGFVLDHRLIALRVMDRRYPRLTAAFTALTCPPRRPHEDIAQVHADLAAALQERTEQVVLHLARIARERTGARLLCVGGGVAMNCVSIGKIIASGLFDEVAVPPAPGDSGTAIGAAAAVHLDRHGDLPAGLARACYLGPSYPGLTLPPEPRPGMTAQRLLDPAGFVARQLAQGTIAGLFQGSVEAGPRALGHRSILASPLKAGVVERLNSTVKFREPFRPFAPVVLADNAVDYFALGQEAPFMSIASPVTDLARKRIPAVVHANGTARVQTLTARDNPVLADILAAFAELTGVPVLINTSLNVKGKPICGTPEMALDCLAESGLDALLIEDWWVTKA
ncbi:carbamoyltransferase C-terminal domain-containing protein [Kitasatospora sp. NPDC093558]|uniref:carbamoyltransferase family protein n=1 Tax=Kitasatospora sp. NPDC093558 TaxID=3155201 RepID=UPI00341EF28F